MLTLNNRCLRVSFQILLTLLQRGFYFCPLTCFVLGWDETRRQISTFHRLLRRSRMTVFKLGAMTRIITMSPWRLLSLNWRIIYIYISLQFPKWHREKHVTYSYFMRLMQSSGASILSASFTEIIMSNILVSNLANSVRIALYQRKAWKHFRLVDVFSFFCLEIWRVRSTIQRFWKA